MEITMEKTTVYLIRHAEAAGNKSATFQGHTDADITENGYRQLRQLSERCKELELQAVYSSPLKRAMETAKAVNLYHQLPIQIHEGLKEINGGVFEGKLWSELPMLFPEACSLWMERPYDFVADEGESMRQVYDRMRTAIAEIVEGNAGKTIAIVSHGCAIRNFLCYASGYPIERIDDIQWCDNTAISHLEFCGGDSPRIVHLNDAAHLSDELSTILHQTWWRKGENQ